LIKEPGADVDIYSRHFDFNYDEPDVLNQSSKVWAETIYISRTLEDQFEQTPSPKWLVQLQVHTGFSDQNLYYNYGGGIQSAEIERGGVSYINIGLEKSENSLFIAHIGDFYEPSEMRSSLKRNEVFALLGFCEGHVWTDIHTQEGGVMIIQDYPRVIGQDYSVLRMIFLDLNQDENGSIPRENNNSTTQHWKGQPTRTQWRSVADRWIRQGCGG
jgi:hypothetical protein